MKKIFKKVVSAIFATALLVSVMSGCKVAKNGNDTKVNQLDPASLNGVTITVAGYRDFTDDPLNKAYVDGAKKFEEKYPGVKVVFRAGGGDGSGQDLVAAIASGDVWDLQYNFGIATFPGVFVNDLYEPLDEYIDFNDPKISKLTVDGTKFKGKTYGISNLKMQELGYASYNETWYKELGVKTPYEYYKEGSWNWENLLKMTAELKAKKANVTGNVSRPNIFGQYYAKWNEDETISITYDSQENREWLEMWRTLIYEYKVNGGGSVAKRETAFFIDVSPNAMISEWNITTNDTIRFIPLPMKDGKLAAYLTDSHWMVPKGAKNIQAAAELAKYLCQGKADFLENEFKSKMLSEDYDIWSKSIQNAYFIPRFIPGVEWQAHAAPLVNDFFTGKTVATHIAERIDSMKANAEKYNNEVATKK